jgi:hypothetical protein
VIKVDLQEEAYYVVRVLVANQKVGEGDGKIVIKLSPCFFL